MMSSKTTTSKVSSATKPSTTKRKKPQPLQDLPKNPKPKKARNEKPEMVKTVQFQAKKRPKKTVLALKQRARFDCTSTEQWRVVSHYNPKRLEEFCQEKDFETNSQLKDDDQEGKNCLVVFDDNGQDLRAIDQAALNTRL